MKFFENSLRTMAALSACLMLGTSSMARAASDPDQAAPAPASSQTAPMVPPAKSGVYSQVKQSATRYRLTVKGHVFSSRDAIEKYLLYSAAELTLQQHFQWFTLAE